MTGACLVHPTGRSRLQSPPVGATCFVHIEMWTLCSPPHHWGAPPAPLLYHTALPQYMHYLASESSRSVPASRTTAEGSGPPAQAAANTSEAAPCDDQRWSRFSFAVSGTLKKNQETKIVRPVGIPKKKVVGLKKTKICTIKKTRMKKSRCNHFFSCGPAARHEQPYTTSRLSFKPYIHQYVYYPQSVHNSLAPARRIHPCSPTCPLRCSMRCRPRRSWRSLARSSKRFSRSKMTRSTRSRKSRASPHLRTRRTRMCRSTRSHHRRARASGRAREPHPQALTTWAPDRRPRRRRGVLLPALSRHLRAHARVLGARGGRGSRAPLR